MIPERLKSEEALPKGEEEDGAATTIQDAVFGPQQNDTAPVWRLDTHIQQL